MNRILIILIFVSIVSCKKEIRTNDNFRKNILSNVVIQKDTLVVFSNLLDSLDKRNVEFCEFFNYSHYAISDSCTFVLGKKYDISMGHYSEKYISEHYNMLTNAITRYEKSLGINQDMANIGEYIEVSNDVIKKYCISEDNKNQVIDTSAVF